MNSEKAWHLQYIKFFNVRTKHKCLSSVCRISLTKVFLMKKLIDNLKFSFHLKITHQNICIVFTTFRENPDSWHLNADIPKHNRKLTPSSLFCIYWYDIICPTCTIKCVLHCNKSNVSNNDNDIPRCIF